MNVNALFNPRRGGRSINPHSRRPAVCLYLLLVAVVAVGFLALTPGNAAAHGHNITVEEPTAIEGGTLTFAIKGAAGARGTLRYELVGWGGSGPMGDVLAAGAAKLSQDYFTPAVTSGFSDGVKSNADGTGEVRFEGASDEQTREIEIPLLEDSVAEGDEAIWIKLTFQDQRNLVFPRSSQNLEQSIFWVKGTVSDKYYSVSITNDEGNEGETLTFEVAVEGKGAGTVEYVTRDGLGAHPIYNYASASSDFEAKTGTLTFTSDGPRRKTITVPLKHDSLVELPEYFRVQLESPTGSLQLIKSVGFYNRADQGIGVIHSDDQVKLLDTQPVEVTEGETAEVSFKLARPLVTGESAEAVARVRRICQSSSHQATEGFDFVTTRPQTLAFSPGNQTATVIIPIIQDDVDEEPRECFKVEIAQAETIGIDLSPKSIFPVEVFVVDDDEPPTFVFSQAEVLEPDAPTTSRGSDTATLRFGVALNRPSERTITVEYSQGTGVGDDQATSGTDYEAIIPGTLTFRPGEVLKHITVTVKGDYDEEPDEKVWVNLSNPVNACFPGNGSCETSDRPILGDYQERRRQYKNKFHLERR